MPCISDLFEIAIYYSYEFIEDVKPDIYFTYYVNRIFQVVIKAITMVALFFALNKKDSTTLILYSITWIFSAIFIWFESMALYYNYKCGQRIVLKVYCFFFGLYQFMYLNLYQMFEGVYSFSGLYQIINICLTGETLLCCCCCCIPEINNNIEYFSSITPGYPKQLVTFRLIGGFFGTIIMLILYLLFKDQDEFKDNVFVLYLIPIHISSETIILITYIIQLCRKRRKYNILVSDKAAAEKYLKITNWYFIIHGFTYGLFEVLVAAWILCWSLLFYLSQYFCYQYDFKRSMNLLEIKDYEIIDQQYQQTHL